MEKSASQEDGDPCIGKFKDLFDEKEGTISYFKARPYTVKRFNHQFQDIKYLITFTYLCIL